MYSDRKIIYTSLAILAMGSSAAVAASLPRSGQVVRDGTVERIVDTNTFILRDNETRDTVDVHASRELELDAGDRVQVNGMMESEMLGIGREIVGATVTLMQNTSRSSDDPSTGQTEDSTADYE